MRALFGSAAACGPSLRAAAVFGAGHACWKPLPRSGSTWVTHLQAIGLEAGPLSQRALVGGVAGSPRRHSAPALQERSLIENRTGSTAPGRAPQHGRLRSILNIAAGLGLMHGGNDARKERHSRDASRWFGYVWHGACGAAPAGLCRDHGRLRAGRICAGGCQSRRWPFCRLCGSDSARNATAAPG
jgi:hypothetical protein